MNVTAQWADSLLGLERLFFLKLAVWGALNVAVATALAAASSVRQRPLQMLRALVGTVAGLGVIELIVALLLRHGAGLRDLESATTLDRGLWLAAGIALGWASVAIVAAIRALRGSRRSQSAHDARVAGAGIGLGVHGLAIAFLSLQLARAVVR